MPRVSIESLHSPMIALPPGLELMLRMDARPPGAPCEGVRMLDTEIDLCCAKLTDYRLFTHLPGASPALIALPKHAAGAASHIAHNLVAVGLRA